jgi:glycerophosphoryl diester phosphodiesterase
MAARSANVRCWPECWQEDQIERPYPSVKQMGSPVREDSSSTICDDLPMTQVIAHRGASRAEPENTIVAFRRAVAMGADGIELDVRRTADDVLVVHHDAVLPDGRPIRHVASSDLPERVPSLSAALDACDGSFVNVEIKNDHSDPDFDPSEWVAHRTAVELGRRGAGLRWLVSSFRLETVDVVRLVAPAVRTAWLVVEAGAAEVAIAAAGGHVAIHPYVQTLDEGLIRAAHAAGLAVNTWTCDDPERMRELIAWGVDGICTNVPDVALAVRRERLG